MAKLSRKSQQTLVVVVGGVAVLGIAGLMMTVMQPSVPKSFAANGEDSGVDMTIVRDRTSAAAPEMSWITTSKAQIEELRNQLEDLRKSSEARELQHGQELTSIQEQYDEMLLQQAAKIAELEQAKKTDTAQANLDGYNPDYEGTGSEFVRNRSNTNQRAPLYEQEPAGGAKRYQRPGTAPEANAQPQTNAGSFGRSFKLASLEDSASSVKVRNTLNEYIPAGSYAPAVVLAGADAATNVADRENPIPVLFRVTGPAVTAGKNGRAAKVNIEGCTVQGSAVGDLSSERVHVRLVSITCLNGRGEVLEASISGYMAGSGKAGARGHVVSREGGLVASAAIAGAFQGLAGAAGGIAGGAGGDNANVTDLVGIAEKSALSAGSGAVEQAATTLSEYLINRAEQYQPVVSLNGGSKVELVFMEGVSFK